MPLDSQVIELLGRNALVSELLYSGLELASPLRDRGVDLVAYVDLAAQSAAFAAVPIQIKVASRRSFSINSKYERISNLLLVYVWHAATPANLEFYALRYSQAVGVAHEMGYTRSDAWANGEYSNTKPGKRLTTLLQPYKMKRENWKSLVTEAEA